MTAEKALSLVVLTLSGTAIGCAEERGTTSAESSYRVGDTTVVVSSDREGKAASLTEVARIGREHGPVDLLLSGWMAFTIGYSGEVYVHDDFGLR